MSMYIEGEDDDLTVKISTAIEIPKPKISSPIQPAKQETVSNPANVRELQKKEIEVLSKIVVDLQQKNQQLEKQVEILQAQKPVTVCLDAPKVPPPTGPAIYSRDAHYSDISMRLKREEVHPSERQTRLEQEVLGKSDRALIEFTKHIGAGIS